MGTVWLSCSLSILYLACACAIEADEIQKALLRHLSLKEPPVLDKAELGSLVISDPLRSDYLRRLRQSRAMPLSRGKRSHASIREIVGRVTFTEVNVQLLTFDMMGRIPFNSEVQRALLKLYKKQPRKADIKRIHRLQPYSPVTHVRVEIQWVHIRADGTNRTFLVDSRPLDIFESGWLDFDVMDAVQYWQQLAQPGDPMLLGIRIRGDGAGKEYSNLVKAIHFAIEDPSDRHYEPQLELHTLDLSEYGAQDDCGGHGVTRCCRQLRYINLQELPWAHAWILEPPILQLYDCVGSCRQPPPRALPSAERKCIPVDTRSMPMIVALKDGNHAEAQVVELHNMNVLKCGCVSSGSRPRVSGAASGKAAQLAT
ncbi:left-right determination factor 1 isoform X2 [Ornithorhynchus anatinus]|uniref:left-right determination factor 1 isoform X2 n=1 Tax=Ornithorhynchus anatinus TaxID=9258 RepID=UPI000155D218|nr:left-right determination factor 1 isoform X2 [Ornithorhynchus anatinus]